MSHQESEELLEVDPNNLSKEVVEELREKNAIENEERAEFKNSIHLKEMEIDANPNSTSLIKQTIPKWTQSWNNFKTSITQTKSRLFSQLSKTGHATIKNIKPPRSDNKLTLVMNPQNSSREFTKTLSLDSPQLANLLAYHNIDDPNKLIGKTVPLSVESYTNTCFLPKNVSLSGKIHYLSFKSLRKVRAKMSQPENEDALIKKSYIPFIGMFFIGIMYRYLSSSALPVEFFGLMWISIIPLTLLTIGLMGRDITQAILSEMQSSFYQK